MESTTSAAPADRRSSAPLTIALGIAVLVLGAIFALASG
jgi:hypothetical protein